MGGSAQMVASHDEDEVSDDEECGDTDEHVIHAAATFKSSGMMSASDSGATMSQQQTHLYSETQDSKQPDM